MMRQLGMGILVFAAASAFAQSSAEVNAGLQFNFLNPGANSLGMGGAFIGGADDATAAFANPAGLVNLSRPELSVEVRTWESDHVAPFRGHAFGPKTGRDYDSVDGIEEQRFRDTGRGLAFASFAFPWERWSLAFYQHELAHYDSSPQTQGIFFTLPGQEGDPDTRRFRPSKSDLRLRIFSRGVAGGYRLTSSFAVGVDISLSEIELDSRTDRYQANSYNAPDFAPENIENAVAQRARATSFRYGTGFTWDLSSQLRIGAVYRREPSFPVTVSSIDKRKIVQCEGRFHVPDVYGAGISYRYNSFTTFNADYNRMRYSQLTRDFVTFPQTGGCQTDRRAGNYVTRDANEYHLGVRYAAARARGLRTHPVILTAGWWREAPHAIEAKDGADPNSILFRPARPNHHYSAGIGVLLTSRLQLAIGTDLSDRQRILSVSTLARW